MSTSEPSSGSSHLTRLQAYKIGTKLVRVDADDVANLLKPMGRTGPPPETAVWPNEAGSMAARKPAEAATTGPPLTRPPSKKYSPHHRTTAPSLIHRGDNARKHIRDDRAVTS